MAHIIVDAQNNATFHMYQRQSFSLNSGKDLKQQKEQTVKPKRITVVKRVG